MCNNKNYKILFGCFHQAILLSQECTSLNRITILSLTRIHVLALLIAISGFGIAPKLATTTKGGGVGVDYYIFRCGNKKFGFSGKHF